MSHFAFEHGQMWNTYRDMEDQFTNYLEYVPLTSDHKQVYSSKLLRLMLQLGGYVDTAFKEMAFCSSFDGNNDCLEIRKKAEKNRIISFDFYLKTFEPIYQLSKKGVAVKGLGAFLYRPVLIDRFLPFKTEPKKTTPKWWQAYNGIKHDMIRNLKKANVENTLSVLGGAFLLNAIFEPSLISLLKENVARAYFSSESNSKLTECSKEDAEKIIMHERVPRKELRVRVDSRLFICMRTFKAR